MSSDPDLDRLADYAAGALDRNESARVAWFIETDPGWQAAYEALVEADAAVQADLLRLVQADQLRMPTDVASRIDAALAAESTTAGSVHPRVAGAEPAPPRVISLDAARARRRRLATTIVSAAAAVVAIAGGITVAGDLLRPFRETMMPSGIPGGKAESDSAGAPSAPRGPTFDNEGTGLTFAASGNDYQPQTLGEISRLLPPPSPPAVVAPGDVGAPTVPDPVREQVDAQLARLTDPAALKACLSTVKLTTGQVEVIDFARFAGEPAVLILSRSGGVLTVTVVGPECGLVGADQRASAIIR